MFSECMHAELAGKGIGVSCVCPGLTATNIMATSRFVGVDAAEEERRRRAAAKLLARRNYPAERVATAIIRAIERRQAVVVLTPEGKATRALSRLSPALARASARLDLSRPR